MKKSTATIEGISASEKVGLTELRPRLGHYLRRVAYGNVDLVVCDNGTPLCRIVPVAPSFREANRGETTTASEERRGKAKETSDERAHNYRSTKE